MNIAYDNRHEAPEISAVYVIEDDGGVLYVGQTTNLRIRLTTHHKRYLFDNHPGAVINIIPTNPADLRAVERSLIDELDPIYNGTKTRGIPHPSNYKYTICISLTPEIDRMLHDLAEWASLEIGHTVSRSEVVAQLVKDAWAQAATQTKAMHASQ